jgi:hypothetical protein
MIALLAAALLRTISHRPATPISLLIPNALNIALKLLLQRLKERCCLLMPAFARGAVWAPPGCPKVHRHAPPLRRRKPPPQI